MAGLCRSIRVVSLLENIVVRATGSVSKIKDVQLLAGERRLRALLMLVEANVPCAAPKTPPPTRWRAKTVAMHEDYFVQVVKHTGDNVEVLVFDQDDKLTEERFTVKETELSPTLPASKLYKAVECNIFYNISDEMAMTISMTENEEHVGLTLAEEIGVVERLIRRGLKQKSIKVLLGSNDTWVSQTASFRTDLPPEVFKRLLDGRMSRHTAVNFFSYKSEHRQKVFEETVLVEERETEAKLRQLKLEAEQHQDEADLLLDDAQEADDPKAAAKAAKQAATAASKAGKARTKRDKASTDAGTITATHVAKGAAKAGVKTKKAKMLPKDAIEALYVEKLEPLLDGESTDPICGKAIPAEYIAIVRATATAILQGDRDPLKIIRDFMVTEGTWQIPDGSTATAEDDEEPEYDNFGPSDEALEGLEDYDGHEDDGPQDMESYMQPDVDNT
jgi:ParB-like chromosome segregation protein Spo0J